MTNLFILILMSVVTLAVTHPLFWRRNGVFAGKALLMRGSTYKLWRNGTNFFAQPGKIFMNIHRNRAFYWGKSISGTTLTLSYHIKTDCRIWQNKPNNTYSNYVVKLKKTVGFHGSPRTLFFLVTSLYEMIVFRNFLAW